jgi:type IV secretory pathway TrbF-like protein
MFRRDGQEVVSTPDVVAQAHEDWDGRIKRAIASETAWKKTVFGCLCALSVSIAGNVWQGAQSKVEVLHIVHDSIGSVITVSVADGTSTSPSQAQLAAAVRTWVENVRTVYIDVKAMRNTINAAFDLVANGSQANQELSRFYQSRDPFQRAEMETVSVRSIEAVPPSPATIGPNGLQTWSLHWIEDVTSRDGSPVSSKVVSAQITFTLATPTTAVEARRDPDGIHIISFSWTE